MRRILPTIACGLLLTACGSTTPAAPATTGLAGPTAANTKTPAEDNGCGPVEICGTATVSGAQKLTTQFFSVLSELNNQRCADWAKGTEGKLRLPRVSNSERTLNFFADEPIVYNGPATYSDPGALKDATLQVSGKTYAAGKAEVTMAADGDGTITLTEWAAEDAGPVTVEISWTCTDR